VPIFIKIKASEACYRDVFTLSLQQREMKGTKDLLKCIPLFPNATPYDENENHIFLVDDDDITRVYGKIKVEYMHNFNMCYKKMEGNKECESVTKIEVFR
jgi:hypothetical protein